MGQHRRQSRVIDQRRTGRDGLEQPRDTSERRVVATFRGLDQGRISTAPSEVAVQHVAGRLQM